MMAKKTYGAVLSGLGNIAWRYDEPKGTGCQTHAGAYEAEPRTTLLGGCSPKSEDREDFIQRFGLPAFASFNEMLDALDPDIVNICSPTRNHYEQTLACIEQGTPMVWLEKPPAESVRDLDRLLARRRELGNKTTVLVNYQRRYVEGYRCLADIYREETLGPCRMVQINYSRGLETNGSHLLDMLFFLVGPDTDYTLEWVSDSPGQDSPCFALALKKGPMVMVSGLDLPYHNIDVTLTFEGGRASVLHGGMTLRFEKKMEHELFPGFFRLEDTTPGALGKGGFGDCMSVVLADLIDSHRQGADPLSSLETARCAQALMEEIRLRQGGGKIDPASASLHQNKIA